MAKNQDHISLSGAVSIGIGGMVGGGIFAVLGLAVDLARGGSVLAFFIAGMIALITSYSYAKLSIKYPGSGGTVNFINQGFGINIFSGGTNNLLWISYIIMLSLYASAFGSYAANIIPLTGNKTADQHLLLTGIILLSTFINYFSARIVSVTETLAVFVKMVILLLFIIIGFWGIKDSHYVHQLSLSSWESPLKIISGGMVIFVAYEGFELIANAVDKLDNPTKNIPRAYYISVISVIILYILIAGITVCLVPFHKIRAAQEYVLAVAAEPTLGAIGFTIISITAMISTFSAINATLYGGSRVNYDIGKNDELPHEFTKYFWDQPVGLLITTILTLLIANSLNLESISTSGSSGFLLIFAFVNLSNYKLYKQTKANRWMAFSGFIFCMIALIVLLYQQFSDNIRGTLAALGIIALSYLIEFLYKRSKNKKAFY